MGFFDSPDEKLRKKLSPDLSKRSQMVAAVAEHYGAELHYHKRAELVYVVSVAYIRHQLQTHGMDQLNEASIGQYAQCVDQASRIAQHFTFEQKSAFDICLQHIEALPDTFEPKSS